MKKLGPVPGHIPGWYTELMTLHNWPPQFKPSVEERNYRATEHLRECAIKNRENGSVWGAQSLVMAGTPKHRPLGWL